MSKPQTTPLSSAELFRSHAAFVGRFLLQLGVRHMDLDDAVQEVFLVVHARGGYVPGRAKVTSYLGSIAVHAAQSYRHRQRRKHAREVADDLDTLPARAPNLEEALENSQSNARVRAALLSLPPDLRAVLLLVELEGESCSSVAEAMGCALGTIYFRAHTARKRFAAALAQTAEDEQDVLLPSGRRVSP
jgi:RNA polymerase sigma-70 factor (ECF subfamily)